MFKYGVQNPNDMFGTEIMAERWKELVLPKAPKFYDYNWGILPGYYTPGEKLNIVWNHLETSPQLLNNMSRTSDETDAYIFVSHWQYRQYVQESTIPFEGRSFVLKNAIDPIEVTEKPSTDIINIVYHSDPTRGLDVFFLSLKYLYKYKNVRFHIYRDLTPVLELIPNDPRIIFHGRVPNEKMKTDLKKMHIYAYPTTYRETSCISLIEAMSAGCYCVHSDFAALPETSMHLTHMYEYNDNKEEHAARFAYEMERAIQTVANGWDFSFQKSVVDKNFGWETRVNEWVELSKKLAYVEESKRNRFALYS
jgi:glycosyltransferase involved in cell wall biosynthesis